MNDPEVGVTCGNRALGGRAMTNNSIREFLGPAQDIVAIGGLNIVIRVVQVNLNHIDIQGNTGDAHNRIHHARPHLPAHHRVGGIGFAV